MQRGLIKKMGARFYGFIQPDDESPDVFFHLRECGLVNTWLNVGDKVLFEINQFSGRDGKGRRKACEVRVINADR